MTREGPPWPGNSFAKRPCLLYCFIMDSKRRDLILRVADDCPNAFPIVHQLDGFVHAERMFEWMIREKMTGNSLVQTYIHDFKGSWLSLGKWVIMMINKDTQLRKVIAGKDYIVK